MTTPQAFDPSRFLTLVSGKLEFTGNVGDRVRLVEGMASGQNATIVFVYGRWMGPDAYCTVVTDSGERHFEKVSNFA